MQNIGYDNRNAMLGLATFTFLIIIYFVKLIIVILMKLISFILGGKFYSKYIYGYISKNSPLVVNSAVLILRYPKIMKSKNPSIDIDRIGLKDKF